MFLLRGQQSRSEEKAFAHLAQSENRHPPPHGASFSHLLSLSLLLSGDRQRARRVRHVSQQVLATQISTEEKKSALGHVADLSGGGLFWDSNYTGGPGKRDECRDEHSYN